MKLIPSIRIFSDVSISQNSMQEFLLRMPSLRHVELIVNEHGHHSLCDGYQWEIFIGNQLKMLTKFDFHFTLAWYQTHDWVSESIILAPFRTSFWIKQERQWFVAYNRQSRSLFTVPRFAPTKGLFLSESMLSYTTTIPKEQYDLFYDRIHEFSLDNMRTSTFCYKNIQKLSLSNADVDYQKLDLSKVEVLTVQISNWTLEMLIEFIHRLMPMLSHLIITSSVSWKVSPPQANQLSLANIRTLDLSQYSSFSDDEKLGWTEFFPSVQRLIISLNTRRQMTILIDRLECLSSASFFVRNCQTGTIETLREPQVTREWIIKHTHRLSINHNFICQTDYQYRSWIHLWIGDCEKQLNVKRNSWLSQCFPRCLSDNTEE